MFKSLDDKPLSLEDIEKCRAMITENRRFRPLCRIWSREHLETYRRQQILFGDTRPECQSIESFTRAIEQGEFKVFGERVVLLEKVIEWVKGEAV